MKKILSIILVSIIVLSSLGMVANAAGDSISAATSISLNKSYSGSITNSSTIDYYKFTLSQSGRINLKLSANISYAYFYIYAANDLNNPAWKTNGVDWNYTTELIVLNRNIDLTAGTYYFCVQQGLSATGDYSFSLNYTSAGESFKETQSDLNNNPANADSINLNTKYYGQIASNDVKDFYKFKVNTSGNVTLTVSAEISYSYYYIYDSSATEVWRSGGMSWNSSTELLSMTKTISLSAGTYYFAVEQGLSSTGNYNFKISSSSSQGNTSTVDLSLSKTSVTIEEGDSATVNCSYTGSNSNGVTISYSIGDNEVISCSWGDWNNKKIPITINGLEEGSTSLKISLKDSSTKEILDYGTITVNVISDGTGNGGSGNGNSGNSGGFSIIEFILSLLGFILSLFF